MTATVSSEIQSLSPSAEIELFILDLSPVRPGTPPQPFHAGTNKLKQAVRWQGVVYQPFPIEASGFDVTTNGALPRPKLSVANPKGVISSDLQEFDDFVGGIVTRKRTFARFLDADNFPGGNPEADPYKHLDDDVWYVERKTLEDQTIVQFELSSPFDVAGQMLPGRQVIKNGCGWLYRGPDCGYTGAACFDKNDEPTTREKDVCAKRLTSCRLRFKDANGAALPLPYGGFVGTVRFD